MSLAYQQLALECHREDVDALSDFLLKHHDAYSISYAELEGESNPIFAEPGTEWLLWPKISLTALFPLDAKISQILHAAAEQFPHHDWRNGTCRISIIPEQNWVQKVQDDFPAQTIGPLHIVPHWQQALPENQIVLRLNPGLAFGTGQHETTRLCLKKIVSLFTAQLQPQIVLDYGCGSGILGLAAKILGAKIVYCIDIDPQAITSTRANAAANNLTIIAGQPDVLPQQQFDLIVANILAKNLQDLAPYLTQKLKPGGCLVLSGVLANQAEILITAYAPWLKLKVWQIDGDWICLTTTDIPNSHED